MLARLVRSRPWRLAAAVTLLATLGCGDDPTPPPAITETEVSMSAVLTAGRPQSVVIAVHPFD